MKESVQNLIQAITQGGALETEKAFAQAMAEKLSPMLDARRAEVAQSMFNSQEEVVAEEESSEQHSATNSDNTD